MIIQGTEELFKRYNSIADTRWRFGNSVLYQMCKEHPHHDQEDVIVGKIWLIGRSYAAAIERRKNKDDLNDDFYYDVVAPKMKSISSELDARIDLLNMSDASISDSLNHVLETHKLLMDAFKEITGLEKRSLASKYLHFHCPTKFFIYDSRAKVGINKCVKRPNKDVLDSIGSFDNEYGDFVCRLMELQDHIGSYQTPRELDSFLLWITDQVQRVK